MKRVIELFAAFFLSFLVLIAVFSGYIVGSGVYEDNGNKIYKYTPYQIDKTSFLSSPNKNHWLGTDEVGRDVLARLIKGTSNSFLISFIATIVSLIFGALLGGLSGYLGGWFDFIFSRVFELFYSLPVMFILILLSPIIGENLFLLAVVLGLLGWLFIARLVRAEVIKLKNTPFLEYAKANGAGYLYLFKNHFFPYILPPLLPIAIFGFSGMLVAESSLSFLGLGVKPPEPSWGQMIYDGFAYLGVAPWYIFLPQFCCFLLC
ncbi:peptide/nickel transport system permease protein [Thermotomaculum hydrothermale]|uniref:Peptide/nickel transport system permease protein n=1 Tax=Thermotomaculum hydrothermale TaxID=981385 RepID=A0A7R6SY49_9BACT|nr:ABC transporter permease [Thermotomaculum hydrothermale]BBB32260.1 peptide/nickel transport system permease protein [Thermotomaculum hydrothermale]